MSLTSRLSVLVGPKSLMLSYCCWPILIVVLLAMPTVPTLFPVNVDVLYPCIRAIADGDDLTILFPPLPERYDWGAKAARH